MTPGVSFTVAARTYGVLPLSGVDGRRIAATQPELIVDLLVEIVAVLLAIYGVSIEAIVNEPVSRSTFIELTVSDGGLAMGF